MGQHQPAPLRRITAPAAANLSRWLLAPHQLRAARQRQSADLHGPPDPKRISASLAAIADPSQRLAIARCYCLFAAADGQGKAAELGLLQTLLQVLGHPELERELPELCRRFRPAPSWWSRFRHGLGKRLARWASPHRRRR